MKRLIALYLSFLVIIVLSGCAMVLTSKVDLSKDSKTSLTNYPKGIRVYPTRVYLLISDQEAKFEFWPDYTCAYDVRPVAIFGTNNFKIELERGQITTLSSNMDTTAAIELIKELTKKAISAAAAASTKGMAPVQIFRMDDKGVFRPVNCTNCTNSENDSEGE
jgi:hypothetical protein